MKLLQVANVATVLGGTGACTWTITRALPEFQHAVFFNSGSANDSLRDIFSRGMPSPVELFSGPSQLRPDLIEQIKPDIILFHNTSEARMPGHIPDYALPLYYQHSAARACVGARNRCHYFWSVSRWLCEHANIHNDRLLYQPVPRPARINKTSDRPVIGRIATPGNREKWNADSMVNLYRALHYEHPGVLWEFVGCPNDLREKLLYACDGAARFVDASWEARSWIPSWTALLYDSTLPESYGRTVCEAQRAGCIPIVSRLGGFVEQINNSVDGFLCSTQEDFIEAVRLVQKPEVLPDLRERAIESGDRRGSLQGWREQFLAWVEAVLEVK